MSRKNQLWNERLGNNVGAGLDDIVALCMGANAAWQEAHERATEEMDAVMLSKLGTIRDHLARIERKAREARQGKYTA